MESKFEEGDSVYDMDDVIRYVQGHVLLPKEHTVTRVRTNPSSGRYVYCVDHNCEYYKEYQLVAPEDALKVALQARSHCECQILAKASEELRGIWERARTFEGSIHVS